MENRPIFVTIDQNNKLILAKNGDKLLSVKNIEVDGKEEPIISLKNENEEECLAFYAGALGTINIKDGIYFSEEMIKE